MAYIETTPQLLFTHPAWAKDFGSRDHLIPGGGRVDAAQFPRSNAVNVTLTADAVAGATALVVTALSGPIPAGTTLRFNGGQVAYVTADAATGAIGLTVEALAFAIPNTSTSQYRGTGKVYIRDGIYVGRTFAERDAGTNYGPALDTDDERFLLYHPIDDALTNPDATFYRPGSLVAENHLPGWATMSAGLKASIRATYRTIKGAD